MYDNTYKYKLQYKMLNLKNYNYASLTFTDFSLLRQQAFRLSTERN